MGKDKRSVSKPNLITMLKTNYKQFDIRYKNWLVKLPLPVEVAIVTVTTGATSGIVSLIWGTLPFYLRSKFSIFPLRLTPLNLDTISKCVLSTFAPPLTITPVNLSLQKAKPFSIPVRRLTEARNLAVLAGVRAGVACAMKRFKGKEDAETNMVAGFAAGVMLSLVCGNQPVRVISYGVLGALTNWGIFKAAENVSQALADKVLQSQAEDLSYKNVRGMLSSLGLDHYEKNFKHGLFTDKTLPLLTDSHLQEVKIPPGPRVLILDYIKRRCSKMFRGGHIAD
uniref:chloroplastic import inner membrane translocase subunit HP30-2-like n=1 Tax=Erigeron canadensis TaxID=72917 RepID=UPI001CB961DA|nr:chloroplastic import inner membrane translocase subunit HP30-2-like [Erigeron canadensis]